MTETALLTPRVALELIAHEGLIQELYKDSEGISTWSIGITNASGHNVDRYKDNPQPIQKCLEIYLWLLETNYIPAVLRAFTGHELTEEQFAAALSFHYNTGAIEKTSWVTLFLDGKPAESETFLRTHYLNNGDLQERRDKEADLFFHGKWVGTGCATVYKVNKPSYTPNWGSAQQVDVTKEIEALLGNGSCA